MGIWAAQKSHRVKRWVALPMDTNQTGFVLGQQRYGLLSDSKRINLEDAVQSSVYGPRAHARDGHKVVTL